MPVVLDEGWRLAAVLQHVGDFEAAELDVVATGSSAVTVAARSAVDSRHVS